MIKSLFNFLVKRNVAINIVDGLSIPTNVLNLLWIADGKYANYNYKNPDILDIGLAQVEIICGFSRNEPSLIYTSLPIKTPKEITPNDKIGYYPSYRGLSPEQRYIYLEWLKNPFEKIYIDIGYVFLFYYGLERYLYLKKSEESFKAILKLLSLYKDNFSFYNYSYDALLYFCIATNDKEKIKVLLKMENRVYSDLVLYAKYVSDTPLYPREIIELANFAGVKNKRYINLHKELFEMTLCEIMKKDLGKCELFLNDYFSNLELISFSPVANMSLIENSVEIPSFNSSNNLKDVINNLLIKTHYEVKLKLKELRKNK